MLMPLGRTANAIKIKTDDGGLRAVNCACCGCGCTGVLIPSELRETLENATSITVWGYNPTFFESNPYPDYFWDSAWLFPAPVGAAYQIYVEASFAKNGCLYFEGSYLPNDADGGLARYGNSVACYPEGTYTYTEGTFTINGEGAFRYYYIVEEAGVIFSIPPVPNLIIS